MALPLILTDTNIVTFVFNVFEGVNGIPQNVLSCNMVLLLCWIHKSIINEKAKANRNGNSYVSILNYRDQ